MNILITLRSETFKIKRTSAAYLPFIVAALIPVGMLFEALTESSTGKPLTWNHHFLDGLKAINIMFLPLFIILLTTVLLQVEYRNNTWKQVLAAPQPDKNLFFSKFLLLQMLIILFLLVYNAYTAITGGIINTVKSNYFQGGFNLQEILKLNFQSYVSVLAISSMQFWLAIRCKNFIASLAIGFCLWFAAPMMIFEMELPIADKYPYAIPILLVFPKYQAQIPAMLWTSFGYALFFIAAAYADFKWRRVRT